jgi:hypothetical protein
MATEALISLLVSASLLQSPPERPLAQSLAVEAQAMDARLQVRPAAQTDPAVPPAPKEGMSRGKKIGIAAAVVGGAALIYFALDDDDYGGGGSGSGSGGY